MRKPKLYPGEWDHLHGKRRYIRTGEYRPPRAGEYYLSGAVPTAYRAPNDLSDHFYIMRPATPAESRCPCCGQEWQS
jgi:hypothetical protein